MKKNEKRDFKGSYRYLKVLYEKVFEGLYTRAGIRNERSPMLKYGDKMNEGMNLVSNKYQIVAIFRIVNVVLS